MSALQLSLNNFKMSNIRVLCVLLFLGFTVGCVPNTNQILIDLNEHELAERFTHIIVTLEDVANNWSDEKFKLIYARPDKSDEITDYKENAFGILRNVCEGKINLELKNKTISKDGKIDLHIRMLCDGAVDFKKLGKGYENAKREEAKEDNPIDDANIILIRKNDIWSVDEFNY